MQVGYYDILIKIILRNKGVRVRLFAVRPLVCVGLPLATRTSG